MYHTMQLAHTIATTGLTIAPGCMGSRGTSEVVKGNGSLHRQAVTSLKPRSRETSGVGYGDLAGEMESCSAWSPCKHSSALQCWALLSPELQLQCLHLNSLTTREACPAVATGWEVCSTFLQLGNGFGEALTFVCSSCSTWVAVGSSRSPKGGHFLHSNLFYEDISEGGWGLPRNGYFGLIFEEPIWWGHTVQDSVIKEGDVLLHCLNQVEDTPHQEAWLAWHRLVGLLHRVL